MKPIKFKDCNIVFAENQPEYFPALKISSSQGYVITCWSLTFKEKLRLLIFGKIWLSLTTFNKPLTPMFISTKKEDIYITSEIETEKNTKHRFITKTKNKLFSKKRS